MPMDILRVTKLFQITKFRSFFPFQRDNDKTFEFAFIILQNVEGAEVSLWSSLEFLTRFLHFKFVSTVARNAYLLFYSLTAQTL
jgi:hypothetical protein